MSVPAIRPAPPPPGDILRFQIVAWLFFFFMDVLMLSTFEMLTWRKVVNVSLGLFFTAVISQGMWTTALAIRLPEVNAWRQLAVVAGFCAAGGGVVGFVMQPIERWAKPGSSLGMNLPPATFTGLWLFYSLMLALWSIFAAAFFFNDRARRVELERAHFAAAAQEAELHAMRLQINPHFLFNSFATLRALVDVHPARARDAINHLSGMLRYSLASAKQPTVALRDELHVVYQFIELESLRLGERLRVTADCEPGLELLRIPPMSVQTLVENAVKFGVANRREGGDIHYSTRRSGDWFEVVVTNPGRLGGPSNSTGLGLVNLTTRLKHLYAGTASLSLTQPAENEVRAELRIPIKTEHS